MTAGPQKILHVIDTTGPGGAETVFIELCTHFQSDRWESSAVIAGPGWVQDTLVGRGVGPILLPPTRRGFDFRYLAGLRRLIRELRIDLVQTHLLGPAVYGSLAGALSGVPVVATFHGAWDLGTGGRLKAVKRLVLRRLHRAVFVSAALQRVFASGGFSFPTGQAVVIHNGVDFSRAVRSSRESVRAELGISPDGILVGAVGNVRRAKSYDVLLRAAARVRQALPDAPIRFVVAGDLGGAQGEALLRERDALGLGNHVAFLGFRSDVESLMGALDVYLSTSQSEGFSLTAVQALGAGVPVVATRSGGPEEIVADGQTGLLVEVGSPAAVADALVRLIHDPAARRRMARAGPPSVETRFSLSRMVEAYRDLYAGAISSRQGG